MSSGELLLTLIVALFVFGPERLPTIARQLARVVRQVQTYKRWMYRVYEQQQQALTLEENLNKAKAAEVDDRS